MKKIIALVMVAMMLVAACVIGTSAEEKVDYTDAAKRLGAINVMKGDKSGNLMLDQGVTRYQAALFFVQALTGETEVEKWNADKQSEVFTDVPEYGTAIDYANGIGLIRGRGNGIYGYNDPITYQDMLVLAVRALGYETDTMAYPSGYTVAARKLGLTEKLASGIAGTQALTRGETAQIIWNMLGIEIAVEDPLTHKILYPKEESSSDGILGGTVKRTTLLNEAGFSQGVIESVVVEYNKAELSSDIATVVLENGLEIAASELGITSRTNPSTFLGLPVTLYVDCAEDKFEQLYSIDEDECEAKIIFVDTPEFTNVVNIGDQTNIKVVEREGGEIRVTLGSETFGEKYDIEVYTLDEEDGWVLDASGDFYDNFIYEDGKFTGANSYGEVDYAVITDEETETSRVLILYKPYEFGLYNTRSIRYQPTVSDESFITIGKYNPDAISYNSVGNVDSGNSYKNPADKYSYFEEYLLGSNELVDKDTTSVSKQDGEAARDARLAGESVRSGDFIFYYYNALDNVLHIGYNCGSLKDGNLTSKGDKAKTVKIEGVTYTYELPGAFTFPAGEELPVYDGEKISAEFLGNLVSGEKNAQFVAFDDTVIYVQEFLNGSNYRAKHNYIITTSETDVMAELLGMTEEKYIANTEVITNGSEEYHLYVSDNGYINIAVLNTTNGKWELAEIAQFECGANSNGTIQVTGDGTLPSGRTEDDCDYTFNHKNNSFKFKFDIKKELEKYVSFGDIYSGYDDFNKVVVEILNGGMFVNRGKTGNVYNISAMFDTGDWGMIDNGLVTDGLIFSDNANKTNLFVSTRKAGVTSKRIDIANNTVIVVIDKDDNVGVRVGLQEEANSILFKYTSSKGESVTAAEREKLPSFLYSGTKNLIVLRFSTDADYKANGNNKDTGLADSSEKITLEITDNEGNPFNVKTWADTAAAGSDETYYVGLGGAGIEYERLDDGTYTLTVSGLFNLRTMRAVSAIKLSVEDLDETNIDDAETLINSVLYMDKTGMLNVKDDVTVEQALIASVNMDAKSGEEVVAVNMENVKLVDDCSATVAEFGINAKNAIGEISVKVINLDVTGLDLEEYDLEKVALDETYVEDNDWEAGSVEYEKNVEKYAFELGDLNTVEDIEGPMAGVLDQYIIDKAGTLMYIAEADDSYFEDAATVTVNLCGAGHFDEEDGVLTLYVVKLFEKVTVE
ncbi:MAG: hypothetical protein E7598_04620 [Ruminococcaceae bacterium]|nr:hypothetical protein [Oscillospiraceae bacterium]